MGVFHVARGLIVGAIAACAATQQPEGAATTRVWSGSPDFVSGDVSRDGRLLSQINWNSGDLQVVDLASGIARDLTGQGYAGGYAWTSAVSPDSRHVAVAWYLDSVNAHELRVIELANNQRRTVVAADPTRFYIDPVDWSDSGDEILVAMQTADKTWQLSLVSAQSGSMQMVKALRWQTPGGAHDQAYPDADLSPDGRYVAYDYPTTNDYTRDIFVVRSDGSSETAVVSGKGSDRLLGWLPGGDGILFYSDRDGRPSIWRLGVRDGKASGTAELIQANVQSLIPLGFTAQGYAYGVTTESERLHHTDFNAEGRDTANVRRPVHDPVWYKSLAADWSPDGRQLAYITHGPLPDPVERLIIATETGDVVKTVPLTPRLHTSNGTLRWATKDRLIFYAYERGVDGVYAMDLRTGSIHRIEVPASVSRAGIKWFDVGPDGRNLYLIGQSAGAGRGNEIAAIDVETGAARVVGAARLVRASLAVSPDGQEIAYLARPEGSNQIELRVAAVNGPWQPRTVYRPAAGPLAPPVAWTPDGSRIVFERSNLAGVPSLWSVAVTGGEPVQVLSDCCMENHVRIHRSGRRVVFAAGADRGELRILKLR